jgi:hypothetical protein
VAPAQGLIMKSRLLLNLFLVALVCALGWFALQRSQTPKQDDAGTLKVSSLSAGQINRISVAKPGHPELRLERQGEGWKLVQPWSARADRYQVERLLRVASATSKSRVESQDLKQFELDPALATVTLNDQVFRFGATNGITFEQYLATGNEIFLVSTQFGSSLPGDARQLLAHSLLNDGEMPSGFDFADLHLSKDKDNGKWSASGVRAPKADTSQDDFNRFADNWRFATALSVAPSAEGKDKGARKSPVNWSVLFQDGRKVQFSVAATEPELILIRMDESVEFHFQKEMLKKLSEISPSPPAPAANTSTATPPADAVRGK